MTGLTKYTRLPGLVIKIGWAKVGIYEDSNGGVNRCFPVCGSTNKCALAGAFASRRAVARRMIVRCGGGA